MEWFEDDQFWIRFAPIMFDADRWADTPGEVDALLKLSGIGENSRILDSCCGVGRHALELARRGYLVTAVDRTRAYLEAAQESAEAEELSIEFILDDVRRFLRPESFDLALNLFTSFGFFTHREEEHSYISNILSSLAPGGIFLIDVNGKELIARDFVETEEYLQDGYRVQGEYRLEKDFTLLFNRWSLEKDGERYQATFRHRIYSAAELRSLLLRGGFSEVEIYGGYDGRPYDHKALRLIVAAKR